MMTLTQKIKALYQLKDNLTMAPHRDIKTTAEFEKAVKRMFKEVGRKEINEVNQAIAQKHIDMCVDLLIKLQSELTLDYLIRFLPLVDITGLLSDITPVQWLEAYANNICQKFKVIQKNAEYSLIYLSLKYVVKIEGNTMIFHVDGTHLEKKIDCSDTSMLLKKIAIVLNSLNSLAVETKQKTAKELIAKHNLTKEDIEILKQFA